MNSGEPQTTDSNPEPKMDRVSQDTEDQEAGADSPAKGLGQTLLTEGQCLRLLSEAGVSDICSRVVKCLTL